MSTAQEKTPDRIDLQRLRRARKPGRSPWNVSYLRGRPVAVWLAALGPR